MIVLYDSILGCTKIIFQLTFILLVALSKSCEAVYEESKNMLAFSCIAIPTRHEVTV